MKYKRPKKLESGDVVAVLSPSWAGPASFPHVYENGLRFLESLGLRIKEYPTTRQSSDYLLANPEERARDINSAFGDEEVKAIFCSIGGNESVRILEYLDVELIKNNPKIFMGYSDITAIHAVLNQIGIVTFYGPSVMSGLAQAENLPEAFKKHIKDMLFESNNIYEYRSYEYYSEGYPNWSEVKNAGKINSKIKNNGWHVLQGSGVVSGKLFGGCIEVLEVLKGTKFWPEANFWSDKILFFETSEEKPSPHLVGWFLRNYGMMGVLNKIKGILFARPRNYTKEEKKDLEEMIKRVVNVEFNMPNLPIVMNLDFGHTDPQFILPLGIKSNISLDSKKFFLVESPLL